MSSHTVTGEWQSFEVRMRRRRAERLLLRAEVAAEAGCLDEAREILAEARGLAPDWAELERVERNLETATTPPPRGSSRRWLNGAAIAATLLLAAFAGFAWKYESSPAQIAQPRPVDVALVRPAASTPTPAARVAELATNESVRLLPAATSPAAASPPAASEADGTRPAPASAPLPVVDTVSRPSHTSTRPLAPVPAMAPVAPPVAALSDTGVAVPPPTIAIPAVEPSQEPLVRRVLDRYASAYSDLDAEAAERVWPGVSRAALSRAFDSLASQRVALGDCKIDVAGTAAQARCAGTATWAPKIGGRVRTEARAWTFELERSGDDWRIVNAHVQNR